MVKVWEVEGKVMLIDGVMVGDVVNVFNVMSVS